MGGLLEATGRRTQNWGNAYVLIAMEATFDS